MSTTFLSAQFKPGGILTNATSAKLSDATGTYGIKRNDTNGVVIADGTNLVNEAVGVYTYAFTDPAPDLTYTYALEFVYQGVTYRSTGQLTGGATTTEPITLAEVKAHLRIDDTESDALLAVYIKAARTKIEAILGRSLLTQTRAAYFDGFRDTLELDYPPLQSVTSITFLNEQGFVETLDPSVYRVVTENTVGRVELAFGASWPATYPVTNAVVVTYVAGYGSAPADVPEHLRLAMLHMVARWYENREPVVVGASATELDGVEERLCYDRLIPI